MDRPRLTYWCILSAAAALSTGCDSPAPAVKPLAQAARQQPNLLDFDLTKSRPATSGPNTRIVRAAYPSDAERQAWSPDEVSLAPLSDRQLSVATPMPASVEGQPDAQADDTAAAADAEANGLSTVAEQQPRAEKPAAEEGNAANDADDEAAEDPSADAGAQTPAAPGLTGTPVEPADTSYLGETADQADEESLPLGDASRLVGETAVAVPQTAVDIRMVGPTESGSVPRSRPLADPSDAAPPSASLQVTPLPPVAPLPSTPPAPVAPNVESLSSARRNTEPQPSLELTPPVEPTPAIEPTPMVEPTPARQPHLAVERLPAVEPQPAAEHEAKQPTPARQVKKAHKPAPKSETPWIKNRLHNAEMLTVLARADAMTEQAFDLARRGAVFTARARFTQALQTIAQANDAEQGSRVYTRSLAAGLTALTESRDFVARVSPEQEIDLSYVVKSHHTPILKNENLADMTTLVALRRYYTFAQEQLALAAGTESAGSMALYGLGKLSMGSVRSGDANEIESTANAMVYYQAALLADSRNFRAANELGVLLARCGKLERSKDMFLRSLAVSPQPAVWYNLAKIHDRLGERDLAARARAQIRGQSIVSGNAPPVRWVDPATFARSMPQSEGLVTPSTVAQTPAPAPAPPAQTNTAKKGMSDWLPWNRSTQR